MARVGSARGLPDLTPRDRVQTAFPGLMGTGWDITSERTPSYNCIAWAAGKSDRWWWPTQGFGTSAGLGGHYWPPGVPRQVTIFAFQQAYATEGYVPCPTGVLEDGYEKIAIYANSAGAPTHAARQLPDGRWASKLGPSHDIEHDAADHIGGTSYGEVVMYMRRPRA